jgi:dihydrofolate reductase
VIESTLISADGVIGEPHLWTGKSFGEKAAAYARERLRHADAMLMGRRTYEYFSKLMSTPSSDYSAAVYAIPKYVFSSTLKKAEWNNTHIVRSEVASAVRDLKNEDGKDIIMYGHGLIGQALLEAGLLDELNLWVQPVIVGNGKLFFCDGARRELRLVATKTIDPGSVILTYEPTR